jgi:histone deacetylase complex regulatory component SIN3
VFTEVFSLFQQRPDQLQSAEDTAAAVHEKMKDIFKDDQALLKSFEAFMPSSLKLAGSNGLSTVQTSAEGLEPEEVD